MKIEIDYNELTPKEKQFFQSFVKKIPIKETKKKPKRNRIFNKTLMYVLLLIFTILLIGFYYTFNGYERYLGLFAFVIMGLCWKTE